VTGALRFRALASQRHNRSHSSSRAQTLRDAASLVGHGLGVPLVLTAGWSLSGVDIFAMIAVIAVLAIAMLFAFEYSTAARRRRRRRRRR